MFGVDVSEDPNPVHFVGGKQIHTMSRSEVRVPPHEQVRLVMSRVESFAVSPVVILLLVSRPVLSHKKRNPSRME